MHEIDDEYRNLFSVLISIILVHILAKLCEWVILGGPARVRARAAARGCRVTHADIRHVRSVSGTTN